MKLRILTVGKLKNKEIKRLLEHYSKRLRSPYALEFSDVRVSKADQVSRVKKEEGEALLGKIKNEYVVVLDERGEQLESIPFSRNIQGWLDAGKSIVFIIGGAAGLSEDVMNRANTTLSLSKMTLPHDFALLILVEQLYRAMTIQRGIPYHKA